MSGSKKYSIDERLGRKLHDLRALLDRFHGPEITVWQLSEVLAIARGLGGRGRRNASMMVAFALVRSRAFLDVGSVLSSGLLSERADVLAIELAAQYLEVFGDYRRAAAMRKMKDEAPDSPTDEELLDSEVTRFFGLWHGPSSADPLSPAERFTKEAEALARLSEGGRKKSAPSSTRRGRRS
jgi:hypothetical protein